MGMTLLFVDLCIILFNDQGMGRHAMQMLHTQIAGAWHCKAMALTVTASMQGVW
jgi:hypothetical protein